MDRQTRHTAHALALNPSFNASMHLARRLKAGLIPLASALIAAEKSTPPRAPRPSLDPDEVLAARLIESIRRPQPVSFLAMQIEPPQPSQRETILEMAGSDV